MAKKKATKDLDFVYGKQEVSNKTKLQNSTSEISGLPAGKDLLNCSKEELNSIRVESKKESKSLEEFKITDGKDRSEKEIEVQKARELEELLGFKEMNPYGTANKQIFQERLDVMSFSEMYNLASRVGLPASSFNNNRSLLKKSLSKSFDHYAQKHNVTVQGQAKPIIDKSSPDYDSVVRLFKD